MRYFSLVIVFLALLGQSIFAAPRFRHFPAIRRATISIETNPSKLEETRELIITDSRGRPAYKLWIVAASLDKRTTHEIEFSISTTGTYAPDMEEKYESNLLNPDYWGHGEGAWVIHPEEVCSANRRNPVRGARREFKFRRMRIVAKVDDVEFSPDFCSQEECGNQVGGLRKMRLTITVGPSASMKRRPYDYDWRYYPLKKCK